MTEALKITLLLSFLLDFVYLRWAEMIGLLGTEQAAESGGLYLSLVGGSGVLAGIDDQSGCLDSCNT